MSRTRNTFLAVVALLLLPMTANADIIWDWSFGGESGQFTTTGTGADLGSASTFDYIYGSFIVTSSAGGFVQSADPTTLPYTGTASSPCCGNTAGTLSWDGTSITDFITTGFATPGGWDFNGLSTPSFRPYIYSLTENEGLLREFRGSSNGGFVQIARDPISFAATPVSVPEPGVFALLGAGLISMGFARRRKAA